MAEIYSFFATTAKGMEPLLAEELRSMEASDVLETRAGVTFKGKLEVAYRACLWSRIANRVLLPLKTFPAPATEKLYAGVKSIRWSEHMTPENTLAVDFSSSYSEITHTHFGALKVKDAICDQFRSTRGVRPSVALKEPDIRVNVYLHEDQATVSLDLSGESLHLRGYREDGASAPLKENLAAAILMNAGWHKILEGVAKPDYPEVPHDFAFLDPMCGSGTLPIEAALMAARIAPGLNRKHFGFLNWQGHIPLVWKRLLEEAEQIKTERAAKGKKSFPRIVGYDADYRAVRVALANVEKAGVRNLVHIEKRDFSACERVAEKGLIILNPPYGERLGEVEELKPLYKSIGDTFKKVFKGWTGYVFTGSPDLSKSVGLSASRRIVLFNGPIECRLLKYDLY